MMEEYYNCATCEEQECLYCSWGFYDTMEDVETECPCCGSMDVQP
jgi:hypothetical protein